MIDPTGPVARRFPLVARPRPACRPLTQRVADLHRRAATADDPAAASSVFNLAALLASDCGLPGLARAWCLRLASLTLTDHPRTAHDAICGLEPIINLARLHTRAGDGQAAWTLLETLHNAISTRQPISIDSVDIPTPALTADPDIHRNLRQWSWAALLANGARALALAGHWDEARQRLETHHGIGNRMLDGRQIAVIATAVSGRHADTQKFLDNTKPGEPWENAVTSCLRQLTDNAPSGDQAVTAYQDQDVGIAEHAVFRTRLGLCLIDSTATPTSNRCVTSSVVRTAMTDGYAAREVLNHPHCRAEATAEQIRYLAELVAACGLDAGDIPKQLRAGLEDTLDAATAVIGRPARA